MSDTINKNVPYRFKINTSSFRYYWGEGAGIALLQKLGYTPDLERANEFIPLLYQCDDSADYVTRHLYLKNGFKAANDSLIAYINKNRVEAADEKVWDHFFSTLDVNPDWLDPDLFRTGSELARRSGLTGLIVLRDYSLMGGYESAAINKPLVYTGALKKSIVKRLVDTVEFWVQITKENAFTGNIGLEQVLTTRMVHSYSRISILQKTDWDSSRWGVPLNHWDMLATCLGFSLVFLVGLRRMGINPSADETAGLIHFWKYIGYLLGIPLEILPNNESEAIEALYYWTMTQREGDDDSKALAQALMEEPLDAHYPPQALMRRMMRELHLFYNHRLLGTYSCELLGLQKTSVGRFGLINIWKTKALERKMSDPESRRKAIVEGEKEQENVRQIYQKYYD